jgi:hypothetical protein
LATDSGDGGFGRFKVGDCCFESFNFIVKFTEGEITVSAQKTPNSACFMVVIYSKLTTSGALLCFADSTFMVLFGKQGFVLITGYPV